MFGGAGPHFTSSALIGIRMSSANTVAHPARRSANANVDLRIGASLNDSAQVSKQLPLCLCGFTSDDLRDQLFQQSLRILQIARVKSLRKPLVNRRQEFARFPHLA